MISRPQPDRRSCECKYYETNPIPFPDTCRRAIPARRQSVPYRAPEANAARYNR